MDDKRLGEWAKTTEGLVKVLTMIAAIYGAVWAWSNQAAASLAKYGILPEALQVATVGLLGLVSWRLYAGYRRFSRGSRLEHPELFMLHPTGPGNLIGRRDDLTYLVARVNDKRLVFLDGESGCGKSALVAAGLIPTLQQSNGLIPVLLPHWGDDWELGPLGAALGALYKSLSREQRNLMAWDTAPDLAVNAVVLSTALAQRTSAAASLLGQRILFIADQFDDYQAQYRSQLIDAGGAWLSAAELTARNAFWKTISTALHAGEAHLLIVTRSDTAAGLHSVSMIDNAGIGSRTITRIAGIYSRPLLAEVAPADHSPQIISYPEGGWLDLRALLERDLQANGALLMQQVQLVLLGMRHLKLLTIKAYRKAGGLPGTESMAIAVPLRAAALAGGLPVGHEEPVRKLLKLFVLSGTGTELTKTQRVSWADMTTTGMSPEQLQKVIESLQSQEILSVKSNDATRPLHSRVWQLSHDYLAQGILSEERLASKWSDELRSYKARFDGSDGFKRLSLLLPISTFTAIIWKRLRGKIKFGDAKFYILMSSAPLSLIFFLCFLTAGGIHYARAQQGLTRSANLLIQELVAERAQGEAILRLWRAPSNLRARVYDLIFANQGTATTSLITQTAWLKADAGLDLEHAAELAMRILKRAEAEHEPSAQLSLVYYFGQLADTVPKSVLLAEAAPTMNNIIVKRFQRGESGEFGKAYAAAIKHTDDEKVVETGLMTLSEYMDSHLEIEALSAYRAVAAKASPALLKAQRSLLAGKIVSGKKNWRLIDAFDIAAAGLGDSAELDAHLDLAVAELSSDKPPVGVIAWYGRLHKKIASEQRRRDAMAKLYSMLRDEKLIAYKEIVVAAYIDLVKSKGTSSEKTFAGVAILGEIGADYDRMIKSFKLGATTQEVDSASRRLSTEARAYLYIAREVLPSVERDAAYASLLGACHYHCKLGKEQRVDIRKLFDLETFLFQIVDTLEHTGWAISPAGQQSNFDRLKNYEIESTKWWFQAAVIVHSNLGTVAERNQLRDDTCALEAKGRRSSDKSYCALLWNRSDLSEVEKFFTDFKEQFAEAHHPSELHLGSVLYSLLLPRATAATKTELLKVFQIDINPKKPPEEISFEFHEATASSIGTAEVIDSFLGTVIKGTRNYPLNRHIYLRLELSQNAIAAADPLLVKAVADLVFAELAFCGKLYADDYAKAYAALGGDLLHRAKDDTERRPIIVKLLTMAAHPLLDDAAASLLVAAIDSKGTRPNSEASITHWAMNKFQISPAELRLPPVSKTAVLRKNRDEIDFIE